MTSLLLKALRSPHKAVQKAMVLLDHQRQDWVRSRTQAAQFSQVINQREIRIVGLRRTGNHAIITWVREQATGTDRHLNNLIPLENPFRYKYEHLRDYYPQYDKEAERYRQEAIGNFVAKDWFLYSYEDHDLGQITSPRFEQKHDLYVGHSEIRYDLLILRDPFNLFASRYKNNYLDVAAPGKSMVDLWIDYAKEFVNETNYLTHNKLCVSYNRWAMDKAYRQQIAEQLGLAFTDAGINKVGSWGGGSSFEGQAFRDRAREMDVTNRWKHFLDQPDYCALFQRPELWHYSEQIFGHIPGTEALRP
jgi:hypothetical protein